MKEVYIVRALRTPIGSFMGNLSSFSATQLGSVAISGVLGEEPSLLGLVDEVYMGNVISANLGQAPARQASLGAGLGMDVPCVAVNKVCASGMKAVMLGAQSIMCGMSHVVVAGGMESMSNIPHYIPDFRTGKKYGSSVLVDGLEKDGLREVYHDVPMGCCGDLIAEEFGITREEQDVYALESYKRVREATESGFFKNEILPMKVAQRKGDDLLVDEDEEFRNIREEKVAMLRPAFGKDGTVTAANASTLNDGAAALLLMSEEGLKRTGATPLARIRAFADAAGEPMKFTTAPALAMQKTIQSSGIGFEDIDLYEINEAFSVVPIVNQRILQLKPERINVIGGAVAMGHPLGCSGARIMCTLLNAMTDRDALLGMASICNGGGGASAMLLERV